MYRHRNNGSVPQPKHGHRQPPNGDSQLRHRTFTVNTPTLARTITVPTITITEGRCANITHAISIATGGMR